MSGRLIKIITSVILVNILFTNFAFAQTAFVLAKTDPILPQKSSQPTTVTSKMVTDAKTSESACKTLSYNIYNIRSSPGVGSYIAQWIGGTEGCRFLRIYNIYADGSVRVQYDQTAIDLWRYYESNDTTAITGFENTSKNTDKAQADYDKQQTQGATVSRAIGLVLNAVLSTITSFILLITATLGSVFSVAVDWILNAPLPQAITIGWTIVRDICNMFFILILIVIALGIILQLEEYQHFGHLLGELVLMAILVNFSKVIATTLIDAVNILIQMFALNDWKEAWVVLYRYVNFGDIVPVSGVPGVSLPDGWMSGLVQGLSKFVFAFVGMATFLALTGMLILRVVVLYLLIILSPLAYALDILPVTKHFAHEWWEYFIKNLIWVPVALLVMDIGILLSREITAQDTAFNIILIMAFFWGAVVVAEHIGAAGGKMIAGYAEKAAHGVYHLGSHATDQWLARGANMTGPGRWKATRRGLSFLSVGAWKEGYEQRAKQKHHESYLVAAGKRHDALNRLINPIPGMGHATDFGLKAEQQFVADEKKLILTQSNDELIHGIESELHAGKGEAAFAYAQKLFENHDGNEVLSKWKYGTDHEGFQRFIDEKFVPILGKDRAYRLGYDLSRTAEEAGHWNFARAYVGTVGNDGKIHYEKNKDASGEVLAEIAKMNPQNADRLLNRLGRGFIEVDVPEVDEATGDIKKDASGNTITKRVNLGLADWGSQNRKTINPAAAGETFNVNTGVNYMYNDSTGTFNDNENLWFSLANKFSKMSDTQIKQARSLVSSPDMIAERDNSGQIIRYSERDNEVISGIRKAGEIKFRKTNENEIKARVFSHEQAYQFLKDKKFKPEDLAEYGDLRQKILNYADTIQSKSAEDEELIEKLKAVESKKKK